MKPAFRSPFWLISTDTIVSVGRHVASRFTALTMAIRTGNITLSSALSRRGPFENSRVGPIRTEQDIFKHLVDLAAEASEALTSPTDMGEVAERAPFGCDDVRGGTVSRRA
jgi:hypothetical protein